jgi:predicted dehydrogenase
MATVIPAMQRATDCEMVAIASRDLASARAAASRLGLPRAYGSYEELLADPEIDAIYNPLPNTLHVPWSIKALEAGKHVLCEKPIAPTLAEAERFADAARAHPHLKVMEAFMYRFHPQWQRARALVHEERLGSLRTVQTFFSYYLDDPNNIRNRADAGGGALLDIGCYAISVARFLFGDEPARVCGASESDPRFQTDRLVSGMLEFGAGTATFTCGTQLAPHQRVTIAGTRGRVEIEIPFNAPVDRPCRMWLYEGEDVAPGAAGEEITLPIANQYTLQGEAFARAVLDDTAVPTPIEDAVANMRVIEAIRRSAATGAWLAS